MFKNEAGLTEREKEILEYRAKKLTYPQIAEIYGISKSRAAQIYQDARRKIRREGQRQLAAARNCEVLQTEFTRGELLVIQHALWTLIHAKESEIIHTLGEMKQLDEEDRIYQMAKKLNNKIRNISL